MKNNDVIQVVYTTEEQTALETNLSALEDFAAKNAPNLNAEDRQQYGSIQDTNKLLVNKCKTLMEQNERLIPAFVNKEEFQHDYDARVFIEKTLLRLESVKRQLEDTKILLDYDNYQDSMAFYRSVRYYANEQEEFAIPVYDELKKYFPRKNGSTSEDQTEE
ncbi:hypothetical protein [Marinifilum fragile]|uniref:hypothetical protein n=1 Tax=Marinifilum fragile TaxID=570161 RepID=UPI0006D184CE|nr:hypothetical protein [Marinifilum fragile]